MVSWKIRTGPRASLRLERLPVQPERGQGETHPRAFADTVPKNQGNEVILFIH